MEYKVKVTVLDKKLYPELQQEYCAVPNSGKCPCFYVGDEFIFSRNDEKDDFWHCGEGTLVKLGKPDNDCLQSPWYSTFWNKWCSILLGSMGCHCTIYLYRLTRRSYYAWMDERRKYNDYLLLRWHQTCYIQDRTN